MRWALLTVALVLAACSPVPGPKDGGGGGGGGSGGAGGGDADAGSTQPLGLNDITVLVPLPAPDAGPVLLKATDLALDGTPLLDDALYQRVIKRPPNDMPDVFTALSDFQVVAVRFDLCDRQLPWPCAEPDDARLRVVFQPILDGSARDIALHGFYEIPHDAVRGVVDALRRLAELQNERLTSGLKVSPALSREPHGAYQAALKELVRTWANSAGLRRLTFFAQPDVFAQIRWVFRGLEGKPPNFLPITIAGVNTTQQDVILSGSVGGAPGYDPQPFSDDPPGLGMAINATQFDGGTAAEKDSALAAMTSVNDPTEHTPTTVQCVACHVSTFLSAERASEIGKTTADLPNRYTSGFNLSVSGGQSETNQRFLRALGWIDKTPLINQRAVNETAQTLTELNQRFPLP
jgi:hypothetical protein